MNKLFTTLTNFPKYEINKLGEIYNISTNHRINGTPTKGYIRVNLEDINGDRKLYFIHRIVAETFLENPNEYKQVDHIDGNKRNNKVENLRWCTNSQNQINKESYIKSTSLNGAIKKFKYVSWNKQKQKWVGRLTINGKNKHIASGDNDEEIYILCLNYLYKIFKDNEFLSNQVQEDLIKYNIST